MGKNDRKIVELMFLIGNIALILTLTYLMLEKILMFEVFLAVLFLIILADSFLVFMYLVHKKMKKLSMDLGFTFITRFMEQPKMEGIFNKNWFQLHFTSRAYSEYWGMPKTYIKLQFKESKKYSAEKLKKYENFRFAGLIIKNIEHVKRPYKNYLLMRVDWYVADKDKLQKLMNYLVKIDKEAKLK